VEFYCAKEGYVPKPIKFDATSKELGSHNPDRISMRVGKNAEEVWRVLVHEIAHYVNTKWYEWVGGGRTGEPPEGRPAGHGRRFTLALLNVYRHWKVFLELENKQKE
jgi:hypothetical protein